MPLSRSVTSMMVRVSASTTNLKAPQRKKRGPRFPPHVRPVLPLPLVVGQLAAVLEPGHGGDESRVVFDRALERGAHPSLDHLVLRLL